MDIVIAKPRYSLGVVELVLALLVAVVLGIATGYTTRALSSPQPPSAPASRTACPLGPHATVWYSARSWACVSD